MLGVAGTCTLGVGGSGSGTGELGTVTGRSGTVTGKSGTVTIGFGSSGVVPGGEEECTSALAVIGAWDFGSGGRGGVEPFSLSPAAVGGATTTAAAVVVVTCSLPR